MTCNSIWRGVEFLISQRWTMRFSNQWIVGGLLLCFAGCGGAPPAEVSGKVQFEGATVETGAIRFYPVTKTSGRGAVAAIEAGVYKIPTEKGLLAGPYKVTITAEKLSGPNAGKVPKIRGGSGGAAEPVEYIPGDYNDDTKLQVEIAAGTNEQDFVLPKK
jgi:hypothetical protein